MYKPAMNLMCAVFLYVTLTPVAGMVSGFFKVAHGYKMTGATPLENITSPTMNLLLCVLFCGNDCNSATYSEKYKTCTTYGDKFYALTTSWSKNPEWCILYRNEPIQFGDWTMVFRAQKGINSSLYSHWMADGHSDDPSLFNDFPIGCYRVDNMDTCTRHFRSALLDNWVNIDQVRFSLYANGTEVAYTIFNGTSTTRQSWFSQKQILDSSWTTLKNNSLIKFFDIGGAVKNRPLVICSSYASCSTDTAYFMAIDSTLDVCTASWSMSVTSYPKFVYSPFNRMVQLSKIPREYKYADVMAISVKQTTTP